MKAFFGRLFLRLIGWRPVGTAPTSGCVIVCAPHTSNIDYLLMIAVSWVNHMNLSFLGKASLFKPPLGWVMRATGGVPVDRTSPQGLVGQLADEFAANPDLRLAIPAEGTRSRAEHWKSGFYRIAQAADVPMMMGFLDYEKKRGGLAFTMKPTGDIAKDMQTIRAFYTNVRGKFPDKESVPRLREEEDSSG